MAQIPTDERRFKPPKVQPTVSMVRPTGPAPQSKLGSPSAVGFNPAYTSTPQVTQNTKGFSSNPVTNPGSVKPAASLFEYAFQPTYDKYVAPYMPSPNTLSQYNASYLNYINPQYTAPAGQKYNWLKDAVDTVSAYMGGKDLLRGISPIPSYNAVDINSMPSANAGDYSQWLTDPRITEYSSYKKPLQFPLISPWDQSKPPTHLLPKWASPPNQNPSSFVEDKDTPDGFLGGDYHDDIGNTWPSKEFYDRFIKSLGNVGGQTISPYNMPTPEEIFNEQMNNAAIEQLQWAKYNGLFKYNDQTMPYDFANKKWVADNIKYAPNMLGFMGFNNASPLPGSPYLSSFGDSYTEDALPYGQKPDSGIAKAVGDELSPLIKLGQLSADDMVEIQLAFFEGRDPNTLPTHIKNALSTAFNIPNPRDFWDLTGNRRSPVTQWMSDPDVNVPLTSGLGRYANLQEWEKAFRKLHSNTKGIFQRTYSDPSIGQETYPTWASNTFQSLMRPYFSSNDDLDNRIFD